MAKQTILTEIGTGEVMYPQTLASLVKTADGGNVDEGLEKAMFKVFDDEWRAAGGKVIVSGVTYGCNGTDDLTYDEAVEIKSLYSKRKHNSCSRMFFACQTRALLPIWIPNASVDISYMFVSSPKITKIVFLSNLVPCVVIANNITAAFHTCTRLREIDGTINASNAQGIGLVSTFLNCYALEEIRIKLLKESIHFETCSKLSLDSISYLVNNAANTSVITVAVHPDVYAKLTGDTTNAAAAALTPEELAQWQQILVDAAEKQITFATA